jgi:cGMP-dependent protein kinase
MEKVQSRSLNELIYLKKLGQGQFGSVYLVKVKDNDQLFALKYVTRAHVKEFGIQ